MYISPSIESFTKLQVVNQIAKAESCTVVCTYMYGYCEKKDGWGTTYCPQWCTNNY